MADRVPRPPSLSSARPRLRISRSRSVLCPRAELPRGPAGPRWAVGWALWFGSGQTPALCSPDEPWARCNLGTSFGCPKPRCRATQTEKKEKTTHAITRVCPGSSSPQRCRAVGAGLWTLGGSLSVAVARMIDVRRRDMLSYTECKASPGAGGLVGLRRVRSRPSLCLSCVSACWLLGSGDGSTHTARHKRAEAIQAAQGCQVDLL